MKDEWKPNDKIRMGDGGIIFYRRYLGYLREDKNNVNLSLRGRKAYKSFSVTHKRAKNGRFTKNRLSGLLDDIEAEKNPLGFWLRNHEKRIKKLEEKLGI